MTVAVVKHDTTVRILSSLAKRFSHHGGFPIRGQKDVGAERSRQRPRCRRHRGSRSRSPETSIPRFLSAQTLSGCEAGRHGRRNAAVMSSIKMKREVRETTAQHSQDCKQNRYSLEARGCRDGELVCPSLLMSGSRHANSGFHFESTSASIRITADSVSLTLFLSLSHPFLLISLLPSTQTLLTDRCLCPLIFVSQIAANCLQMLCVTKEFILAAITVTEKAV